jgi:hypothetical protein
VLADGRSWVVMVLSHYRLAIVGSITAPTLRGCTVQRFENVRINR